VIILKIFKNKVFLIIVSIVIFSLVIFSYSEIKAYNALKDAGRLDDNTLYFIYQDNSMGTLYMGSRIIGGGNATEFNLNDLADVIVENAKTNSFLVKNDEGNWTAKTLQDVVTLIAANIGDLVAAAPAQVF
jgi:hypothetical protein